LIDDLMMQAIVARAEDTSQLMAPTPAKDYLRSVLDDDECPDTEEKAVEMLIESHRRQWEIIHEMPIAVSWRTLVCVALKMRWARWRRWSR
jgi:hypothetical protein